MQTFKQTVRSMRLIAALILVMCGAAPGPALAAETAALKTFASPEEAVAAMVADLKSGNLAALSGIFGPRVERLLNSGDPVADRDARARFVASFDEAHRIDQKDGIAVLVLGKDDWPFPIPLRKAAAGWQFDTAGGEQELVNRRIGRNELVTIQTMLAYVDAQQEYAEWAQQRTGTAEYAQLIASRPGKQDGLYWPTAEGQPQSPLGALFAVAQAKGYRPAGSPQGRTPYNGYFFKILTGQGPNAPGGKIDYIVKGKMIGGFGLVAWPAKYGDSGVMSFIVNHEGTVYQKNLGPQSAAIAEAMKAYDPDPTWQKADVEAGKQ